MKEKKIVRAEEGQAIVEFVIVFPIQLLFTLGIMQLSLLYIAKQMTEYAAFQAARAALVYENGGQQKAQEAAAWALTPITKTSKSSEESGSEFKLDGSYIPGSKNAHAKTRVRISTKGSFPEKVVTATVDYDYELIIPLIGNLLANPSVSFLYLPPRGGGGPNAPTQKYGSPHVTLHGYASLPRPW